jgi:hypothetical protein
MHIPKNVPQTGRLGFDEFLELERRGCGFLGVNRAIQGRPFPQMGRFTGMAENA